MTSPESAPELTSAMEDYLEAIYHLENERRIARVRDIANRLGVKMSSVSSALKSLSSRGLIRYDPHQYILLTEEGIVKAKEIVRRHETLKGFLTRVLNVEDEVAEENACRLEHGLDPEIMDKLVRFLEFVEMCPVDQTRWVEGRSGTCNDCLSCLKEATSKVKQRRKAQEAAIAEGMTLSDVESGSQVMVEQVQGTAKYRKQMARDGLEAGAIALVESKDPSKRTVQLAIKGYHIFLNDNDASKVLVKPV